MKIITVLLTSIILSIISIYPIQELDKKLYHLKYAINDSTYMAMIDYNTKISVNLVNDHYVINFKGGLPKRFVTKEELLDNTVYYQDLLSGYLYYVEQEMKINKNDIHNFPDPSTLVLNRILSFNSGSGYDGVNTISEIRLFTEEDLNIGKVKTQKTISIILLIGLLFCILFIYIIKKLILLKIKK